MFSLSLHYPRREKNRAILREIRREFGAADAGIDRRRCATIVAVVDCLPDSLCTNYLNVRCVAKNPQILARESHGFASVFAEFLRVLSALRVRHARRSDVGCSGDDVWHQFIFKCNLRVSARIFGDG